MNPTQMEVTYKLTREDFWEFHRFTWNRRGFYPFNYIAISVFAALTFLLLGLRFKWPWPEMAVGVSGAASFGLLWHWLVKRHIMGTPLENGAVLGECYVRLDPEAIFSNGPAGERIVPWKNIKEIGQTEGYVFLFLDAHIAYIIPKRAFADSKETETFLSMVKASRTNSST